MSIDIIPHTVIVYCTIYVCKAVLCAEPSLQYMAVCMKVLAPPNVFVHVNCDYRYSICLCTGRHGIFQVSSHNDHLDCIIMSDDLSYFIESRVT